jgi:hypothetical protein
MTPGELAKLNKLPQRLPLFPGQVLYVPARDAEADAEAAERRTSNSSIDEPTTSGDHLQCNSAADSGVDTDIERRKSRTFISSCCVLINFIVCIERTQANKMERKTSL